MSLTTTMGLELTYVPEAVQIALNRGIKATPDQMEYNGERDLLDGFQRLLKLLCEAKKIPLYGYEGVKRDPGVVEVVTRPSRKLSTLLSVARRVTREANAIGLSDYEAYTGGGGCHIHTGIIGDTSEARRQYTGRMVAFIAQNPAFAWATLDIVDDINAKPITRERLTPDPGNNLYRERANMEELIRDQIRTIHSYSNDLHPHGHLSAFTRERIEHYHIREVARMWKTKKRLRDLNKKIAAMANGKTLMPVEDINWETISDKHHVVRVTAYGNHGTIEFRSFEMGEEAKLKRNIILANAICRYVEKQTYTEFDLLSVPKANDMRATKWSEARRQWLELLAKLGLDPRESRDETAQIARRWRAYRDSAGEFKRGDNPTAVDKPFERDEDDNDDFDSYAVVVSKRKIAASIDRYHRVANKRSMRGAR